MGMALEIWRTRSYGVHNTSDLPYSSLMFLGDTGGSGLRRGVLVALLAVASDSDGVNGLFYAQI